MPTNPFIHRWLALGVLALSTVLGHMDRKAAYPHAVQMSLTLSGTFPFG